MNASGAPGALKTLLFLACAAFLLPACGGGNKVRSEAASPEIVRSTFDSSSLTLDSGTDAEESSEARAEEESSGAPSGAPTRTFVEKIGTERPIRVKTESHAAPQPTRDAEEAVAPAGGDGGAMEIPPAAEPEVEVTAAPRPTSGGVSGWLWLLLLLAAIVSGWYFWSRKRRTSNPGGSPSAQPHPPLGGLSPVSGFLRDRHAVEEHRRKSGPAELLRRLWEAL